LNNSVIAVELPINVPDDFNPFGAILHTEYFILFGIQSAN